MRDKSSQVGHELRQNGLIFEIVKRFYGAVNAGEIPETVTVYSGETFLKQSKFRIISQSPVDAEKKRDLRVVLQKFQTVLQRLVQMRSIIVNHIQETLLFLI
jgi:uncharacterized lipoprotein YehR (DUF1307 family)